MKAVCTWKEKDCPKMGPINCDADIIIFADGEVVTFCTEFKLGDVKIPILQHFSTDEVKLHLACMDGEYSEDDACTREKMDLEHGWLMMTCDDDAVSIDIHCVDFATIEVLDAQIELNKSDRRKMHYSIRQALKVLEECGGYVDIANIPPEIAKKYKIMDKIKDWSEKFKDKNKGESL